MIILVPHQSTVRPELRFQFTHGESGIHKLLGNRFRIAHTDQINNDPAHRQQERNNQQEVHIAKYFILIEKHHNQKIDAPSGTALYIADEINSVLPQPYHYEYDRHSVRKKRDKKEIGIHAVRGGTIVGEHDVLFAGRDEMIEIRHSAASKEIFAIGAVSAAQFMVGKPAGLYDMNALLSEIE